MMNGSENTVAAVDQQEIHNNGEQERATSVIQVEEQDEEQVIKRVDHSIPEMQHPAITPTRELLDLVKPIDLDSA